MVVMVGVGVVDGVTEPELMARDEVDVHAGDEGMPLLASDRWPMAPPRARPAT